MKFTQMATTSGRGSIVILGLLLLAAVSRVNHGPPDDRAVVSAYLPSWSALDDTFSVTNFPPSNTTHLIYAFAKPTYEEETDTASVSLGGMSASDQEPDERETLAVKKTLERLHRLKAERPRVKTLVSIGGWALSEAFSDIAASEHARKTFTAACMDLIFEYGFRGIDIDWEFPVEGGSAGMQHREEDAHNLVLLLQQLRRRLDMQANLEGRPYFLTLAVAGDYRTHERRYLLAESAPYVDWFHLMAYDFAGGWDGITAHSAPLLDPAANDYKQLSVHGAVQSLLTHGVPRDKIVLGINFSGRRYIGVEPRQPGLHQPFRHVDTEGEQAGNYNYRRIVSLRKEQQGLTRTWDDQAKAVYLFDPKERAFISFEDPQSVATKAVYTRTQGLRGVMCWSVDKDDSDYTLLNTLQRSFLGEKTQDLQ